MLVVNLLYSGVPHNASRARSAISVRDHRVRGGGRLDPPKLASDREGGRTQTKSWIMGHTKETTKTDATARRQERI